MEKKTVTEGGVSETQANKYRRTLELFDGDVDKMMHTPPNEIRAAALCSGSDGFRDR